MLYTYVFSENMRVMVYLLKPLNIYVLLNKYTQIGLMFMLDSFEYAHDLICLRSYVNVSMFESACLSLKIYTYMFEQA